MTAERERDLAVANLTRVSSRLQDVAYELTQARDEREAVAERLTSELARVRRRHTEVVEENLALRAERDRARDLAVEAEKRGIARGRDEVSASCPSCGEGPATCSACGAHHDSWEWTTP